MFEDIYLYIDPAIQMGFLFCGALGVLSFYFTLNYLKTRRRVYLFYCLFLLFSLLEGLINLGSASWLSDVLNYSKYVAGSAVESTALLAFCFYCVFALKLLEIRSQNKRLYKIILYLGISTAVYGIAYWIIRSFILDQLVLYFFISRIVILLWSIVAIYGIIKCIKSPVKPYFLLGTAWYFLGTLFAVIRDTTTDFLFDAFYYYSSTIYFQIGILLEVTCFSLALIYKIYRYYEGREAYYVESHKIAILEKEKARAESLALQVQINPHFLFNYLNVLKYYIQLDKNDIAVKHLIRFSKFIRKIGEINELGSWGLSEELDLTKQYLDLEKIRYGNRFDYQIVIKDLIRLNQMNVPPLFLQPFVDEYIREIEVVWKRDKYRLLFEIYQDKNTITIDIREEIVEIDDDTALKTPHVFKDYRTKERIILFNKNNRYKILFYTITPRDRNSLKDNFNVKKRVEITDLSISFD